MRLLRCAPLLLDLPCLRHPSQKLRFCYPPLGITRQADLGGQVASLTVSHEDAQIASVQEVAAVVHYEGMPREVKEKLNAFRVKALKGGQELRLLPKVLKLLGRGLSNIHHLASAPTTTRNIDKAQTAFEPCWSSTRTA